uniref:NADH-ubiquinone oxidoreductase chain 3 n=2 Tax=Solenopsis TaxID=13685 RepID=E3VRX6_SOLIN|nr:NADH dehydrogenase subunit 3 [Solenopsis richteri]ADP01802.1 NADH dehydrogenase subunit 3 [Solenopsis richteri]ADP01815.1 NADH dehydrogenase subunit 3 [Solenopsis invicta]
MTQMIYILIILLSISSILIMLNFLISKKSFQDREKISPFECGFDPISKNRLPFSIQFFLISLIFLIFDIEITLLIPLIFLFKFFNIPMILSTFFILIMLLLGLYFEYSEKSIDWKI